MKRILVGIAATLALAACSNPKEEVAEKQADAVEAQGEATAAAIDKQAMSASTEPAAEALQDKADAVEDSAEAKADAIEKAAKN